MTTTYDGATVRLYVNGALVSTKTASGSIATTSLPLHIGGNSGLGEWFQGRLDDIRVYNRALTVAEIQTDMNTAVGPGAPPPPPPPADQVGSWTPPTSMPLVAVHITLLPNGRVCDVVGRRRRARLRDASGIPRRRRSSRLPAPGTSSAR